MTVTNNLPATNAEPKLIEITCEEPDFCSSDSTTNGPVVAYRLDNSDTPVSTSAILSEYSTYETKKTEYEKQVQEAEDSHTFWSYFVLQFAPVYPEFIGTYDGKDWQDLTSLGGWGDYTIQPFVQDGDIYPYGVWGGEASYTAAEAKAQDTNPDMGATRYAAIMIFVPSGTITAANTVFEGTVQAFAADNSDFVSPPEDAMELGSMILSASASLILLATLF